MTLKTLERFFKKDGGVWDAGEGKYTLLRRRAARSPNHDSAPRLPETPPPPRGCWPGPVAWAEALPGWCGVVGEGNLWRGEEPEYYFRLALPLWWCLML